MIKKKYNLIIFTLIVVFSLLIANTIIYNLASEICAKSEIKPVRYELGGLFGNIKIAIVTTEGNEDGFERVCIEYGKPQFFSISENLDYIIKMEKENNK